VRFDLYVHDEAESDKLDLIINFLKGMEKKIMAALDDLTTQVTNTNGTVQSAIVLLNGLYAALIAAGTDPTKLAALAASLKTNTDSLAAAIVADQPPGGGSSLTITTTSPLPAGTNGTPYSGAFTATGGTAPYTFAVTGGSLPPGLTLATDGTLSGTPSLAGNYNFSVTVTDSANATFAAPFALTVN
jgi:hypothetical protein